MSILMFASSRNSSKYFYTGDAMMSSACRW